MALTKTSPTVIFCPTSDPIESWQAHGPTREIAEAYYMIAIVNGAARLPLYRIVIQNKVDQHPPIDGPVRLN